MPKTSDDGRMLIKCSVCNIDMVALADPPDAHGIEFVLFGCLKCQTKRMHCFCITTGIGATEPVTEEDAAVILSGTCPDLKAFMKAWGEKNNV